MYASMISILSSDHPNTITSSSFASSYVNLVNGLNISSDHTIPPSSSVASSYVNLGQLCECLSSDHTISSSVFSSYVYLINCSLNTSHLTILSHSLLPSLACMLIGLIVEYSPHLITLSNPLPSQERM